MNGRRAHVVEVDANGLTWIKSSASNVDNCVEVAIAVGSVLVRSSHDPGGRRLTFPASAWSGLLSQVQ